VQAGVLREQLHQRAVGLEDVVRVTRERDPAKRAPALAEERTDEGGHETREVECVLDARVTGVLADVVAVVEHGGAALLECQHRPNVRGDRLEGAAGIGPWVALAQLARFRKTDPGRHVSAQRVVRTRLVGDDVGLAVPAHQLGLDLRCVADERNGARLARVAPALDPRDRLV
jgi:hypothetical protein